MLFVDIIVGFCTGLFNMLGANSENDALRITSNALIFIILVGLAGWLIMLAISGAWWWAILAFFIGTGALATLANAFKKAPPRGVPSRRR